MIPDIIISKEGSGACTEIHIGVGIAGNIVVPYAAIGAAAQICVARHIDTEEVAGESIIFDFRTRCIIDTKPCRSWQSAGPGIKGHKVARPLRDIDIVAGTVHHGIVANH